MGALQHIINKTGFFLLLFYNSGKPESTKNSLALWMIFKVHKVFMGTSRSWTFPVLSGMNYLFIMLRWSSSSDRSLDYNSFLTIMTYHFIYYLLKPLECNDVWNFLFSLQDLAIFIILFPWMIVLRHPPYQRKLRSMLPIKRLRISDERTGFTNVNGKMIIIQQTAKTHFDILKRYWL